MVHRYYIHGLEATKLVSDRRMSYSRPQQTKPKEEKNETANTDYSQRRDLIRRDFPIPDADP